MKPLKTIRSGMHAGIILAAFLFATAHLFAQNLENIGSAPAFTADGSIGLNLNYYSMKGAPSRYRPFDYSLVGNATFMVYGIAMPFSATISEQNRSYAQPFNQFGVSPQYKWATLHAGWRSMQFSPYTLAGHSFLGAALELNPGKLRFTALYGRFLKAVRGDDAALISPSYDRFGYGIKLGYGSPNNFVDLIFFQARDYKNSIPDTLQNSVSPGENTAFGLTGRFDIWNKLSFEWEGAASLYTIDSRSKQLNDSFNIEALKFIKDFLPVRTSTQLTTAFQAGLNYRAATYGAKLGYKRIEPDYKTMGMYYSESDVENYTIAPWLALLKNRMRLGGSIGVQRDNLLNTKRFESQRVIGSFDASYNMPVWGVNARYSSYGITQTRGLNPVIDSLKVARVNHSVNLSGRYSSSRDSLLNVWTGLISWQALEDLNARTAAQSETRTYNVTLGYQRAAGAGLAYGGTINFTLSELARNATSFVGPILQASRNWRDYSLGGSAGYQAQFYEGKSAGGALTINLNSTVKLWDAHALRIDGNFVNSATDAPGGQDFSEMRVNFGYIYNFNAK